MGDHRVATGRGRHHPEKEGSRQGQRHHHRPDGAGLSGEEVAALVAVLSELRREAGDF